MKVLAFLALWATSAWAQTAPSLRVWTTQGIGRKAEGPGGDLPLMVGSLQKPFVAKAWGAAHPGQEPPRYTCAGGSDCWHRSGHSSLGLAKALALSCNAYFRQMAADTPLQALRETFGQEGFLGSPSNPDEAIGLLVHRPILIVPCRLLDAYSRLVREPWPVGEGVRQHVLSGLRAAPLSGTAALIGKGGCWAKTGTVPASDGDPTKTRGLVLVIDDEHRGTLAELDPGTGREAAAALRLRSQKNASGTPWQQDGEPLVRVRLFDLMPTRNWRVRNLGSAPLPCRSGFLGPGSVVTLGVGEWIGPGLLEVEEPGTGLIRRLEGRLSVVRDRGGRRQLIASVDRREYVAGVIAGELPKASEAMRVKFGAVILRFLARGSRHEEADVCDCTHCAWFIGRGPRPTWAKPDCAIPTEEPIPRISDVEWASMQAGAREPGPSFWTTDCGSTPLSSHAVWGDGDRTVSTPLHHHFEPLHWRRMWKTSDIERAFDVHPEALEIRHPDGVWTLTIRHAGGTREFRFDEAHRRIAKVLGWDALPSPASEIQSNSGGVIVSGTGQGHRVGLCLKECRSQ